MASTRAMPAKMLSRVRLSRSGRLTRHESHALCERYRLVDRDQCLDLLTGGGNQLIRIAAGFDKHSHAIDGNLGEWEVALDSMRVLTKAVHLYASDYANHGQVNRPVFAAHCDALPDRILVGQWRRANSSSITIVSTAARSLSTSLSLLRSLPTRLDRSSPFSK